MGRYKPNSQKSFRSEKRNGNKKRLSIIQPKYTSSFANVSRRTTNLTRGWGQEGINKYNNLCKEIVLDRKERNEIDNAWFVSYREIYTKTKKRKLDTFVPIAWNEFDDLFEHIDSDSEDDNDSGTLLNDENSNTLINGQAVIQGTTDQGPKIVHNMSA